MIFSRLRHPQTLAALVHLRSFGKGGGKKKTTALFVHRNILRATQTMKKHRKKESKIPRLLCLDWIHTYTRHIH